MYISRLLIHDNPQSVTCWMIFTLLLITLLISFLLWWFSQQSLNIDKVHFVQSENQSTTLSHFHSVEFPFPTEGIFLFYHPYVLRNSTTLSNFHHSIVFPFPTEGYFYMIVSRSTTDLDHYFLSGFRMWFKL